ncbi:hypothetical protein B0H67DRAFT_566185 [Lasiosphaeris hirsuta]|uniref:Uncharacterized protein n=1 Tax=Lasiosphaeris hirsuta TaxID=260670 RepID=A0AA40BCU4_9PEZI|nr:hypothetical protein B0H67DRAFT_566185 [Lasiosphaeris hirsuta]
MGSCYPLSKQLVNAVQGVMLDDFPLWCLPVTPVLLLFNGSLLANFILEDCPFVCLNYPS